MEVNDRALMAAFARLSNSIKAKTLGEAAELGLLPIVKGFKRDTPVDTGTQQRSFHVGGATRLTPDYNERKGNIEDYKDIGGDTESPTEATRIAGTTVSYSPINEFTHKTKAGFMRRGIGENQEAGLVEIKKFLVKVMEANT